MTCDVCVPAANANFLDWHHRKINNKMPSAIELNDQNPSWKFWHIIFCEKIAQGEFRRDQSGNRTFWTEKVEQFTDLL